MDPTSIKIFLLFHEGLPTASDCSVATEHAQRITVTLYASQALTRARSRDRRGRPRPEYIRLRENPGRAITIPALAGTPRRAFA